MTHTPNRAWRLSGASLLLLGIGSTCIARTALAQPSRTDTLWLNDLQRDAERADQRGAQVALIAAQSALRLRNIQSEHLPTVTAIGSAQYLSDVARIGAVLPGVNIPGARNDQYDTYLSVRQPVFDPTRKTRIAVEQAQEQETQARVRSVVWQQRAAVSEAFFGVVLRDAQVKSLDVAISDLEARSKVASRRVTSGVALPSEALLLTAEIERRRQSRNELSSDRDAARDVLSALIGRDIPVTAALAMRTVDMSPAFAVHAVDTLRARPEFAQFDRSRSLIDARRTAVVAQDLPKLSAFGRTGYGRPGLNPLGRNFDAYWTAGVQLEWSAWNWGRTRRDAESQQLQRQIVSSEESAFGEALKRAAITERARITSLERTLQADDSIIAMRDRILRETRLRHDEGEVNSADYVSRLSEELSAQLDRDTHRVRLAESRARYLTTLGLEVR